MKLILFNILILHSINLIASSDFITSDVVKDLTLTAPNFQNAFKDTDNIYYQQYGSKVMCKFYYEPFRFESDRKLETGSYDELDNYRLKLKNIQTNQVFAEEKLDNKLVKFVVNSVSIHTYVSNGLLQFESILLEKTEEYACCIGLKNQNQNDICSLLRFEKKLLTDKSQFSLLSDNYANIFNTKITNLEKIIMYSGIGFFVISILLFALAFFVTSKPISKKNNIVIPINDPASTLFTIQVPQIPTENILKNDLYTRYNLVNDTESNKTIQIDCCEFPPTYEELSNKELANSKQEVDSKF